MSLVDEFKTVKQKVDYLEEGSAELLSNCFLKDPFNVDIMEYILVAGPELGGDFMQKVLGHFIKQFPFTAILEQAPADILSGKIFSRWHYFDPEKQTAVRADKLPWIYTAEQQNPRYHIPLLCLYKRVINWMYQDCGSLPDLVAHLVEINHLSPHDLWAWGLMLDHPRFAAVLAEQVELNTDAGNEDRYDNFLKDFEKTAKHAFWQAAMGGSAAAQPGFAALYFQDTFSVAGIDDKSLTGLYTELVNDESLINLYQVLYRLKTYPVYALDCITGFDLFNLVKIYIRKTIFLPNSIFRFFNSIYLKIDTDGSAAEQKTGPAGIMDMDHFLLYALLVHQEKQELFSRLDKHKADPLVSFLVVKGDIFKNADLNTFLFYALSILLKAHAADRQNIQIINAILDCWCTSPFPFFQEAIQKITDFLLQKIDFHYNAGGLESEQTTRWMNTYGLHCFKYPADSINLINRLNREFKLNLKEENIKEQLSPPQKYRLFYHMADVLKLTGQYDRYFDLLQNQGGLTERDLIEQDLFALYRDSRPVSRKKNIPRQSPVPGEDIAYVNYLEMLE